MFSRIGEEILTSICCAIFAPWVSRVIVRYPIQSESASSQVIAIAVIFYPHSSPQFYLGPSSDIATGNPESLGVFANFAENKKISSASRIKID